MKKFSGTNMENVKATMNVIGKSLVSTVGLGVAGGIAYETAKGTSKLIGIGVNAAKNLIMR